MHIQLGKDHTSVPRLFSVLLVDEAVDFACVYSRIPRKRSGARQAVDVFLGGLCHLGSIRVSLGTPSGGIFPRDREGCCRSSRQWGLVRIHYAIRTWFWEMVTPLGCACSLFRSVVLWQGGVGLHISTDGLEMIFEGSW